MKHLQELVELLKGARNKYRKDYEIEVRLGRRKKGANGKRRFDPNLGSHYYKKVLKELIKEYEGKYEHYQFEEYKLGSLRLRLDSKGKVLEFIKKRRVKNKDVSMGDGYFARVSVSKETPVEEPFRGTPRSRPILKERHVFKDDGYQIELSKVTKGSRSEYLLEIELLNH